MYIFYDHCTFIYKRYVCMYVNKINIIDITFILYGLSQYT
jgi:hypothetical protein